MTLPSGYYSRDPADIVELQELRALRQRHGCSACALRGAEVLGKRLCGVPGRQPGKNGSCRAWEPIDRMGEAA